MLDDALDAAMRRLAELLSDSERRQDDLAKRRGTKRLLLIEGARWQGIRDALNELEQIDSGTQH